MNTSRRRFIKTSVAGFVAAAAIGRRSAYGQASEPDIQPTRRPLGRAISGGLAVRERPSIKGTLIRRLQANDVVKVLGQVVGDGPTDYNPIWYRIPDGYVHSGYLQPAENTLNEVDRAVALGGQWGEVTVPFSVARERAEDTSGEFARYYYGCVIRVNDVIADAGGIPWYRISEGDDNSTSYIRAEHVHPITPDEISPLSPNVPRDAKRIEVDLKHQKMTAFEFDRPVFSARVATGAILTLSDGSVLDGRTPAGEYNVFLKIAGQRMNGGRAGDAGYYNLRGVGWVSYFVGSGIAFHGTYWHNDYGRPRSRGCVNMLPEDAKWVFRWTRPTATLDKRWTRLNKRTEGTQVKVL